MSLKDKQNIIKKKDITVLTHDGVMHGDDVLCVALLYDYYGKEHVSVTRKRPDIFDITEHDKYMGNFDFVVDTGGITEISEDHAYFDHHDVRDLSNTYNNGVIAAACGKLADFLYIKDPDWLSYLRKNLVDAVEAEDNGQSTFMLKILPSKLYFVPLFNKFPGENSDNDEQFLLAADIVYDIICRMRFLHRKEQVNDHLRTLSEVFDLCDKRKKNIIIPKTALSFDVLLSLMEVMQKYPKLNIIPSDEDPLSNGPINNKYVSYVIISKEGNTTLLYSSKEGYVSPKEFVKEYVHKRNKDEKNSNKIIKYMEEILFPPKSDQDNSIIHSLSVFNYRNRIDNNDIYIESIKKQIKYISVFLDRLYKKAKSMIYSKEMIEKVITPDETILYLPEYVYWAPYIAELNKNRKVKIKIVISKNDSGNYTLELVKSASNRSKSYIDVPDSWKGKSGKAFYEISGISGAVFCHSTGFISIFENKDAVFRAASYILAFNKADGGNLEKNIV